MNKILLLFTIISLLCISIQARMIKKDTCPNDCGCPRAYKPVCGESGRTHGNLCLANCSGDKVAKDGVCTYKCTREEKQKKVKICKNRVFGLNSYRKRCCSWIQDLKGKKTNKSCQWEGEATTVSRKSKCKWIKKGKNVVQRRCCKWTVRTQGKNVRKSKTVCSFVGKPIKKKHIKRFGCAYRTFGKYGRRKFCCSTKRVCQGTVCKDTKKKCGFVGKVFIRRQKVRCQWVRKNGHSKQNRCCTFEKRCVINKKSKKCRTRKVGCSFRGPIIRTRRVKHCSVRRFGRNGTRNRCCSWNISCNLKKKCRKVRIRCTWSGPATYNYIRNKCQIKRKSKGVKQRFCCSWKRTCLNKKCKNSNKQCQWVGQLFIRRKSTRCVWIRVGLNTRRRKCCEVRSKCKGNKCRKVSKRCKFVGSPVSKKIVTLCKWKRFARFQMRKNCCLFQKICVGKKCKNEKGTCRWVGYIISKKVGRKCSWKRVGKFAKRLRCCSTVKRCHSKLGRCKLLKNKCYWSSKVIRKIPRKSCAFRSYGNKSSKRNKCCSWVNYCIGKQCRPISKRCRWTGFVYQKQLKNVCNWRKKQANSIQRNCCKFFRVCRIRGFRRQCKNGKKLCKWIGAEISTTPYKNCVYKQVGRFSRRKLCCRFKKVCKGKICSKTSKKCGFIGSTYTLKPVVKCLWRRNTKLTIRRRCCEYTKHCIDKKCQYSNKKCKFTGKSIKASVTKRCVWRTVKSKKHQLAYRRRFCCTFNKLSGRIVKNTCRFRGNKVFIRTTYWKKRRICSKSFPKYTCCTSAFKCVYIGKHHSCKYFKKLGCQTFNQPKVVYIKTVRKCKTLKHQQTCCLNKYKCVTRRTFGKRLHGKCKLVNKSQCSTQYFKRNHVFNCESSGDPHYTTFSKKRFDFYNPGDWVLGRSQDFSVSTRTKQWNRASVNTRLAARVNKFGETFEVKARSFGAVFINKKLVEFPVGKKYNFYYGGKAIRRSPNHFDIYSANGDLVTAYTFDMGIYGRRIRVPFIMNIFMKVADKNEYKGLCSGNNKIIKSDDFNKKFVPKIVTPPKPCRGHLRRVIQRQCNRKFGTSKRVRGCVVDLCSNLPLEIENQAKKEKEEMKKVELVGPGVVIDRRRVDEVGLTKSGNNNLCVSWGDPHFKSFNGKKFDNYFLGDYSLVRTKRLSVDVRQRRWGGASVNRLFAAKINGAIIEADRPEFFLLNKKERFNIKVGQTIKLMNGGKVERVDASRWLIISKRGGYVDVRFFYYGGKLKVGTQQFQRRYMNFIVKVPKPKRASGFCGGKTLKSSKLFSTPYVSKHTKLIIKSISRKCRKSARLRCLNRHVQRSDLHNCISDVCRGLRAKNVRKFEKTVQKDARKWRGVFKNLKVKKSKKSKRHLHFQNFGRGKNVKPLTDKKKK